MYRANFIVQLVLLFAVSCSLAMVVATARPDEQGEHDVFGASAGTRELKSSGGIGAFSPPAPGFSRTGAPGVFASSTLVVALVASIFALLF